MSVDLGGSFTVLQLSVSLNLTFSAISSLFSEPLKLQIDRCSTLRKDFAESLEIYRNNGNSRKAEVISDVFAQSEILEAKVKCLSHKLNLWLYYPCRMASLFMFFISLILLYLLYYNTNYINNDYFVALTWISLMPVFLFSFIFAVIPIYSEIYCNIKIPILIKRSDI
jgi:hypothetical protein